MIHKYNIIVKENKDWHEWSDDRFLAEDDYFRIACESAKKEDCINFVKGSILHALAHQYVDKVPDVVTIEFTVIEE
jgi:hypothetical protein